MKCKHCDGTYTFGTKKNGQNDWSQHASFVTHLKEYHVNTTKHTLHVKVESHVAWAAKLEEQVKRTTDKASRWKVIVLEEGEKVKYGVPFLTFKNRVKQTEDGLMELRTGGTIYACADLYEMHQQRVKFQKGN